MDRFSISHSTDELACSEKVKYKNRRRKMERIIRAKLVVVLLFQIKTIKDRHQPRNRLHERDELGTSERIDLEKERSYCYESKSSFVPQYRTYTRKSGSPIR